MSIPVLILSMVLFFVLFFGIGFLLNMILRATWVMAIIYPIVCFFIIDTAGITKYFQQPQDAFSSFFQRMNSLGASDLVILTAGMCGAIFAGITIKLLRKSGYRMF